MGVAGRDRGLGRRHPARIGTYRSVVVGTARVFRVVRVRRLSDLFGIAVGGAQRYADAVLKPSEGDLAADQGDEALDLHTM